MWFGMPALAGKTNRRAFYETVKIKNIYIRDVLSP